MKNNVMRSLPILDMNYLHSRFSPLSVFTVIMVFTASRFSPAGYRVLSLGNNDRHLGSKIKMPSVNEFLKKICASDKFLKSIGALGNFNEIEKLQFKKIETAVQLSRWNEEDTAVAVAAVKEASMFTQRSKQSLLRRRTFATKRRPRP